MSIDLNDSDACEQHRFSSKLQLLAKGLVTTFNFFGLGGVGEMTVDFSEFEVIQR